jgi:hypothetical protein
MTAASLASAQVIELLDEHRGLVVLSLTQET